MPDLNTILGRITDLGSEVVDKTLIAQIYGEAGVGKTKVALDLAHAVAPEGTRILYVDSLQNYVIVDNHPGLEQDVIRFGFERWDELAVLVDGVRRGAVKDVSVIVWDELSSISEVLLDTIHRQDSGTPDDEIPFDAIDAKLYKPLGDSIGRLMLDVQKAGIHQIIVAHERSDSIRPKVFHISPGYSPKNRDAILKKVTVSARYTNTLTGIGEKTEVGRVIQSRPTALIGAKTRIGSLPFQTDPETWVGLVADWVYGDAGFDPDTDLANEANAAAMDGVPLVMSSDEDDEPAGQ